MSIYELGFKKNNPEFLRDYKSEVKSIFEKSNLSEEDFVRIE